MFELLNTMRILCDGCGKHKLVGVFDASLIQGVAKHIVICPACLDKASLAITNKADKLYFDRDTGKFINLYKEDIQELERLYPNIDVIWMIETAMPRWLNGTKGKKKSNKSNWNTFMNNWLKIEQLKALGVM